MFKGKSKPAELFFYKLRPRIISTPGISINQVNLITFSLIREKNKTKQSHKQEEERRSLIPSPAHTGWSGVCLIHQSAADLKATAK